MQGNSETCGYKEAEEERRRMEETTEVIFVSPPFSAVLGSRFSPE
jgi:hypothetical protein